MIIKKANISELKKFKVANIKQIKIDAGSATVHAIAGSNGTGKTSLIESLIPKPAVRTKYEKQGKHQLEIEHKNDQYILTADFKNHHSPHSFTKNGTELNISGTSGIQQELIEKHLGLTPKLLDLLCVNIDVCKMTQSQRKQMLMEFNPTNTSLVLEKHKKISTLVRKQKSNIELLTARKSEIESKMLDASLVKELNKEIVELTEIKRYLERLDLTLCNKIDELKNILPKETDFTYNESELKELTKPLPTFTHINRETYKEDLAKINNELLLNKNKQDTLSKEIVSFIEELNGYHNELKLNVPDEEKQKIYSRITNIEKELKDIHCPEDILFISNEDITTLESIKYEVDEILGELSGEDINVCTLEDWKEHELKYLFLKGRLDELTKVKNKITFELDELHNEVNKKTLDKPKGCLENFCELYVEYYTFKKKYTTQIDNLNKDLKQNELELVKTKREYDELLEHVKSFKIGMHHYKRLLALVDRYPSLKKLGHYDVNTIKQNPYRLSKFITHTISSNKLYVHKQNLLKELDILKSKALKFKDDNTQSLKLLKKIIKDKQLQLEKKQAEFTGLCVDENALFFKGKVVTLYSQNIDKIRGLEANIKEHIDVVTLRSSISYYEKLSKAIRKYENDIEFDLRNKQTTIKEQDSLKERLEKEIGELLSQVQKEYNVCQELEKALSPQGIPHKYMINFLNVLISNMNLFIERVFSYPFKILKLDKNKPINYRFKVKAKDMIVDDLNDCSEGQRAMINLAFSLAMVVQLNLTDYPMYLDEIDSPLDPTHKQELLNLLSYLMEDKIVSQLFIVNHHAIMNGLSDSTIITCTDNVLVPEVYNEYVEIKKI